jgi:hypothetical protein
MGPRSPESDLSDDAEPETIVTDINPFLLEYFIYHDSLATVTMPSPPSPKPRFQGSANCSHHDPSMIGVYDGLCDFVTRISVIRAQADAGPRKPDGKVVEKAFPIFRDLEEWKPKDMSHEWRLIAQFYQWALMIWLYSIVYPHEKENFKVQDAVQRMARLMKQIKSGDGVMSCLLFPLFVIGTAAIRDEDRSAISFHFKRLKDWSSLGNIDLAEGVVQKMWSDHDLRKPDSWDWVKQLESRNLSILIT